MQGLTADAVVVYTDTASRVLGTFYRDIGFSWDASRALYTTNTLNLNYYRVMPLRLEAEVNAESQWLQYIDQGRDTAPPGQRRWTLLGALGFRVKPWIRVGANAEREVSSGTETWDAWRFTAYLYYGSYRFRKLDRPLPR